MVRRRMQGRPRHAANGLNVRGHLGGGEQAAVAGLGALPYLDQDARRVRLHAGHGLDDAVPAEMPGSDLQDHVLKPLGFQQLDGHTALARTHAHGKAALLVEVGRSQRDGLPRPRGQRADGHIAENDRINPVQRGCFPLKPEFAALGAQREFAGQEHTPERGQNIKGMPLGIQRRVGHLADAAYDDVIKGALRVQIGPSAALGGAVRPGQQRIPAVRVADGTDGLIGAHFFTHAAADTRSGKARLLPDDGTGQVLPNRFRLARTGNRQILPHDRDFKRVQGTARHTAAAHGTALGPIVDDPP